MTRSIAGFLPRIAFVANEGDVFALPVLFELVWPSSDRIEIVRMIGPRLALVEYARRKDGKTRIGRDCGHERC